ncbi:hypothetical protein Ancab_018131 [Ancistrocladus abbreviatus]
MYNDPLDGLKVAHEEGGVKVVDKSSSRALKFYINSLSFCPANNSPPPPPSTPLQAPPTIAAGCWSRSSLSLLARLDMNNRWAWPLRSRGRGRPE